MAWQLRNARYFFSEGEESASSIASTEQRRDGLCVSLLEESSFLVQL